MSHRPKPGPPQPPSPSRPRIPTADGGWRDAVPVGERSLIAERDNARAREVELARKLDELEALVQGVVEEMSKRLRVSKLELSDAREALPRRSYWEGVIDAIEDERRYFLLALESPLGDAYAAIRQALGEMRHNGLSDANAEIVRRLESHPLLRTRWEG